MFNQQMRKVFVHTYLYERLLGTELSSASIQKTS